MGSHLRGARGARGASALVPGAGARGTVAPGPPDWLKILIEVEEGEDKGGVGVMNVI